MSEEIRQEKKRLRKEILQKRKEMAEKDGYGLFEWSDGKKYKGYWKNGKQDGEGEFYNPQTNVWRKCLVKNGKRVRWLDEE